MRTVTVPQWGSIFSGTVRSDTYASPYRPKPEDMSRWLTLLSMSATAPAVLKATESAAEFFSIERDLAIVVPRNEWTEFFFSLKNGFVSPNCPAQFVYFAKLLYEKYRICNLIGPMLPKEVKFYVSKSGYFGAGYTARDAICNFVNSHYQPITDERLIVRCGDWYEAYIPFLTMEKLKQELEKTGMWKLYEEIELPLVYTLSDMEKEGILVNGQELQTYGEELAAQIGVLEQEIYEGAGEVFNINSPKQLGVILFEKLQMPYGKKTKTGYSTAADVLEKLAGEYPLVSKILEYRQLAKLKSTYADGLANYIDEDGRIRTTFQQTVTATGRLSSTEPNLQNIPIRMELGRMIRKVFHPKEDFVFLDADYSQIELRILAHMSGDENLIAAYREAQDIHRMTASQVFHTPFEEVTDLQRRNAKAVNFGIVYGISSFGLSQDLSISKKEAQEYIQRYFETYPKIKEFLDTQVEMAKKEGYTTTMFGRRRPIPEISSSNFMQRSFGERIAMNSPIQGSAADIIKIAMNRVHRRLEKENLKSKLILQVHDELLIETAEEEVETVSKILEEEMKGAANLAVELEVDSHAGKNWYEAK